MDKLLATFAAIFGGEEGFGVEVSGKGLRAGLRRYWWGVFAGRFEDSRHSIRHTVISVGPSVR